MYRPFELAHAVEDPDQWTHALSSRTKGTTYYRVEHPTTFWREVLASASGLATLPEDPSTAFPELDWTISERLGELAPVVVDVALRFPAALPEAQTVLLQESLGDVESDVMNMTATHLLNGLETALRSTYRMPEKTTDPAWKSLVLCSEVMTGATDEMMVQFRFQWPHCRVQPSTFPFLHQNAVAALAGRNVFAPLPCMPMDPLSNCVAVPTDRLSLSCLPSTHPLIPLGALFRLIAVGDVKPGDEPLWGQDRFASLDTGVKRPDTWRAHFSVRHHQGATGPFKDFLARHTNDLVFITTVDYGEQIETPRRFGGKTGASAADGRPGSSRSSTPGTRRVSSAPTSRPETPRLVDTSIWSSPSGRETPFLNDVSSVGSSASAMQARAVMAALEEKRSTPSRKKGPTKKEIAALSKQLASARPPSQASAMSVPAPPPALETYNSDDDEGDEESPMEDGFTLSQARSGSYNTISTSRPSAELEAKLNPQQSQLPSYEESVHFFEMIHPSRAQNLGELKDIMAAWYTTCGGRADGLVKLLGFARKGNCPLSNDELTNKWNDRSLENKGKTCRTLAFFARQDAYTEYTKWFDAWMEQAYLIAMSGTHYDAATAFYRYHWLELMVSGKGKPQWYVFRDHRLEPISDLQVNTYYGGFVIRCDEKRHASQLKLLKYDDMTGLSETEQAAVDNLRHWLTGFNALVKNLKHSAFSRSVLLFAGGMLFREDMDRLADANPGLKACHNGVIVCDETKAYVRSGRPEDFCTMKMDFYYRKDYSVDHDAVKQLLEFYHKLFCDDEVEQYMRRDFASLLFSANQEKFFRVWIGAKANNGKSTLAGFISSVFDDYARPLTVSMYTGKDTASEASMPQLKSTKNCAVAFMSETKEGQELNENRLKEHTGNDVVAFRSHHEEMQRMRISFKLIMHSNFYPQLSAGGTAMILRAVFIMFDSLFSDDAPDDIDEQYRQRVFKNDGDFNTKLAGLKDAFGWLIINDYADYKAKGLKVFPDAIRKAREEYWKSENFWGSYVSNCIEPETTLDTATGQIVPNKTYELTDKEILTHIKTWIDAGNVRLNRKPDLAQVQTYISRLLGPAAQRGKRMVWQGVRFASE